MRVCVARAYRTVWSEAADGHNAEYGGEIIWLVLLPEVQCAMIAEILRAYWVRLGDLDFAYSWELLQLLGHNSIA